MRLGAIGRFGEMREMTAVLSWGRTAKQSSQTDCPVGTLAMRGNVQSRRATRRALHGGKVWSDLRERPEADVAKQHGDRQDIAAAIEPFHPPSVADNGEEQQVERD